MGSNLTNIPNAQNRVPTVTRYQFLVIVPALFSRAPAKL